MTTPQDELADFKSRINLSEYAAGQGYEVDPRVSSRNSVGMTRDGDKVIIGMGDDRHWIYFSVRDPADHGSIIDFIQNRKGTNLGQVRRELRPWLDGRGGSAEVAVSRPPASSYVERLDPVSVDLTAVRDAYEAARPVAGHHPYLCEARGIPAALLSSDRFTGRVRRDARGNALFPHWGDGGKVCGFEIKNHGFTGFAKHGMKGLWGSRKKDHDRRLVIAETAIDALSYAALFGHNNARFVSIAGQMNPQQPGLLNRAIRGMPPGSSIVLAMDHDDGGRMIVEYIEPVFGHVHDTLGRGDLSLVIDHPPTAGQDWNDVLRAPESNDVAGNPRPHPLPGAEQS